MRAPPTLTTASVALLLLPSAVAAAHNRLSFVASSLIPPHRGSNAALRSPSRPPLSLWMAVELEPEPEGGEELKAVKATVPDCRMKKMKELPPKAANMKKTATDTDNEVGVISQYWMTAVADGNLVKELRTKLLKEASRKANFPGFRKVRYCLLYSHERLRPCTLLLYGIVVMFLFHAGVFWSDTPYANSYYNLTSFSNRIIGTSSPVRDAADRAIRYTGIDH